LKDSKLRNTIQKYKNYRAVGSEGKLRMLSQNKLKQNGTKVWGKIKEN